MVLILVMVVRVANQLHGVARLTKIVRTSIGHEHFTVQPPRRVEFARLVVATINLVPKTKYVLGIERARRLLEITFALAIKIVSTPLGPMESSVIWHREKGVVKRDVEATRLALQTRFVMAAGSVLPKAMWQAELVTAAGEQAASLTTIVWLDCCAECIAGRARKLVRLRAQSAPETRAAAQFQEQHAAINLDSV